MGEVYFDLKRKLEELGYNNCLPVEAVPLVECILADLLQTTRSLQHYMDLSKDALMHRDKLVMEAEPYRCDNAKLIQENNQLHKEIIQLKEDNLKLANESKRKIKSLSEELTKKDHMITKLQHEVRDLGMRGLCAGTLSSRNKMKRKDGGDYTSSKICVCDDKKLVSPDVTELNKQISFLQEQCETYTDEIQFLKNQVEHRQSEIIRLNGLLECGKPIAAVNKEYGKNIEENKIKQLLKQLHEIKIENETLKKDIVSGLDKQHEAMSRALTLAEKNKNLEEELHKVDMLALNVEDDCNKRLAGMKGEYKLLEAKLETLSITNMELQQKLSQNFTQCNQFLKIKESMDAVSKENISLQKQVDNLKNLNQQLREELLSFSELHKSCKDNLTKTDKQCPTKEDLQNLIEVERKNYEMHILNIQEKLNQTVSMFDNHIANCQKKDKKVLSNENDYVKDLHNELCQKEQNILMLKKENNEIRGLIDKSDQNSKETFKDIISQLNIENSELSKENILLSQQLSQYRNLNTTKNIDENNHYRKDIQKLKGTIESLTLEMQILRKDKHEYNLRYKEATDLAEKLQMDLIRKQKEIEHIEQENCSYKMSNRTDKASADHLREECQFLREEIRKMQSDIIKEKTMSSQIKNIQIETERSNNEVHSELLSTQRKLTVSKETIECLEQKCKELQGEIVSLKSDKSNLIDSIKKLDQDRDKLVIDLDHKAESNAVLEQKLKSQSYEIQKLENEKAELKRKVNVNKVSEHKIIDYEAQIIYLNGEILRLTQQYDNAIIENKQLQNSLADANGTLKITKIEYEKSRKEVEGVKQQLQHYVAEIRRIEELLSQKEADRSDMLEHFASLSVEANILENTNHSLESESASKSLQMQSYISRIQTLEAKLADSEDIIDSQSSRIATMTCKITTLENEVKLLTEEKHIIQQNNCYLKQMCSNIQSDKLASNGKDDTESEIKLYENKIKNLCNIKAKLEVERDELKSNVQTVEKLLSNSRREIVELKLALQDATSETKLLKESVSRLNRRNSQTYYTYNLTEELELPLPLEESNNDLPLTLEETINEIRSEQDDDSSHYHGPHYSKYNSHGSTI